MLLDSTDSGVAAGGVIAVIFLVLVGASVYFFPSMIAFARHQQEGMVLVLNLFLGWTLIGWVVSLAIAVASKSPGVIVQQSVGQAGASGPPQVSADGRWYWDGYQWQPIQGQTPRG